MSLLYYLCWKPSNRFPQHSEYKSKSVHLSTKFISSSFSVPIPPINSWFHLPLFLPHCALNHIGLLTAPGTPASSAPGPLLLPFSFSTELFSQTRPWLSSSPPINFYSKITHKMRCSLPSHWSQWNLNELSIAEDILIFSESEILPICLLL